VEEEMEDRKFRVIWYEILKAIKMEISKQAFNTYFSELRGEMKAGKMIIIAPKKALKEQIEKKYISRISEIAENIYGRKIDIEIIVEKKETMQNIYQQTLDFYPTKPTLKPEFTFNNFVVGENNNLAYAACRAVAENPSKMYNPLFIYGGVGLGKTHLLQAIAHHITETKPHLKVIYTTTEEFISELVSHIKQNKMSSFKRKYRSVDVLLIDDIQFLEKTEQTQEEFFHTFNTLYTAGKQIAIASDRAPKELGIEERLKSRFSMGIIVDIKPPNLETRIAILKKKMELQNVELDEELIEFMARNIRGNVRNLEGALLKIIICKKIEKMEKIAPEKAKSIIRDYIEDDEENKKVSFETILQKVAEYFGIQSKELLSKQKSQKINLARAIAVYLSTKLTDLPITEIGNKLGGRSHSTIISAKKNIEKRLKEEHIKQIVDDIERSIKQW
jgi:chromosomal replication initiator protein